ncbi:MAG: tRNA adenosine(34) deaminase TadA [Bacillota bacterium]
MQHSDDYYMQLALEEAKRAYQKAEVPIGAVIVDSTGQVLAASHNLREELADPTAHAEVLAIREAAESLGDWRLYDCTIYVTIEPCIMCVGALIQSRVSKVVYGAADTKGGAVDSVLKLANFKKFNHQLEVESGVLESECRNLMKSFFAELRENKLTEA